MSTPNHTRGSPVDVHQHNQSTHPHTAKSASSQGVISLILCAAAVISAPMLLALPILGFIPAALAGIGIIVAGAGLRGATQGNGLAVTGLILSVLLFALLAGVATFWHVFVAGPTITDPWFQDGLDEVWDRLFGS